MNDINKIIHIDIIYLYNDIYNRSRLKDAYFLHCFGLITSFFLSSM